MSNAAKYAVAIVNGAFDVTIIVQRFPSFRKVRATLTSSQIECRF